jgi:putative ABC transport system permease protein
MFKNNLTLAFRHLLKNKMYAAINIFGLAVSLAACLLIWRILRYELSFNQNFPKHERIVRVLRQIKGLPQGDFQFRGFPLPAMTEIKAQIRDFEAVSQVREDFPTVIVPNLTGGAPLQKLRGEEGEIAFFVEPDFFKIFDFKWLAGDPKTALNETGSIVLSRKVAEKCFQTAEKALGQTVSLNNQIPVVVRGVIENLPENTDFPIFSLTSYATLRANAALYFYDEKQWDNTQSSNNFYALLRKKEDVSRLSPALAEIGKSHFEEASAARKLTMKLLMQPLDEMHFDEKVGSSVVPTVSRARLWILGSIGFLVLAMACFNFINLATALASTRAREVGVRKAIGGAKSALIAQFMTETSLIVAFSVVLAVFLAKIISPFLSKISDVPVAQPFFSDPKIWLFLGVVSVVVAALSGLWPSFVLAGMTPIRALKNIGSGERRGTFTLRKGLVVAQFAIAQALIIGAIVTISQLDFLQKMDLGFSKDLVLTAGFGNDSTSILKIDALKRRFLEIPAVESVSFSADQPASNNTWQGNFAFGIGTEDQDFNASLKHCDADYQKTYGLQMLAGTWFAPSDTAQKYVINETMCRKIGVEPAAAVGQSIRLGGANWLPVCGVVKDFHSHSAHEAHEPILMLPMRLFYGQMGLKLKAGNLAATTESARKAFDATFPDQIFETRFLDESVANFYKSAERFSTFCKAIAALAVLIGCLGLFGLASHTAEKRRKEIGVRKVLGASVGSLTGLLARDFLILVLLAIVVAAPISIYFMQKWLSDFAFRIQISWWMIAATAIGAVAIAFLTVSFQAVKAAVADPVKSLRSD